MVDDPQRNAKLGAFVVVLVVGWVFILRANNFHVTAPVVMVCLGYLCVVALVFNLWRTGAAAVAPEVAAEDWGRPIGEVGELEKEKRTLLKAIKEAEFDHAMGKLSKRDAESLIAQYRARAIEVIKELDRQGGDAKLTVREQIDREVKARREISKRGKKIDKQEAKLDAAKVDAANAEAAKREAAPKADAAKPDAATPAPKPDAATPAPNPEQIELVLVEASDVGRAEALLGKREDVSSVERIDGGVIVSIADHKHVVALMTACEGEGIRVKSFSVREAKS